MSKDIVKLQKEKLNIGEIVDLVVSPNCGAVSTFSGTTRDNFENKKVVKLEYEAYEPMALKEMKNVCGKIRLQWNVERIAIFHRLGEVPVSEVSVIIAVSSPHRQESLQAVQYAIDTLKASVPIWKKEIYDTENSQWKENEECSWSTIDAKTMAGEAVHVSMTKTEDSCTDKKYILEEESKEVTIDPNLVQIRANPEELNRRIESFIERKRQQVNIVNVQEFCCHRDQTEEKEGSCARVDAILIRRKDSKSHMKVHRVLNPWGPQTVDPSTLYKTSTLPHHFPNMKKAYSSALEERLSTSEKLLGMNGPVPRDVYERLKNIEDRLLHLESISPEYKDFWVTEESESLKSTYKPIRKRTFSTAELDTKLHELEDRYVKKIK
ncbi:molybdopterin synthase catalytic subunit [Cephus cinctus]|uniref:Molybdopterin synthase catalytic subunit n=1 Tax=Cephus cinctus TaxID=211228 RepID=A0AAJ7BPD8_CEPCN|nr:molybdopterin synthase catalytic subunit [Cephus cinctus]